MTQEVFEGKIQSLPLVLRDNFRGVLEISASKRIVNRLMSVVHQAYAEGQRAALSNGAKQEESTEEIYRKGYDNGYEHGAEDMREALLTIAEMDVVDQRHYFKLDDNSVNYWYDALYMILHATPEQTLKTVDLYRDRKLAEKDRENREKVEYLAQALGGMDVLEALVKELKKEDAPD